MKAAVVIQQGELPTYVENFEKPENDLSNGTLVKMQAVSIKNLDKMQASGTHYSAGHGERKPKVVGSDGVGTLENGDLVYGFGLNGTMAEFAYLKKDALVPVPKGLDVIRAAAIPNAAMGAVMALKIRAQIKSGDTVLINGATGVTGKMAVQMAKYYGAKTIIATGRNLTSLKMVEEFGADIIIPLTEDKNDLEERLAEVFTSHQIDIVIDYLWGNSAESILKFMTGKGTYTYPKVFVNVGAMSGDDITLPSALLRSTDLKIMGSGLGSWNDLEQQQFFTTLLPEVYALAVAGKIKIETLEMELKDIHTAWQLKPELGERIVIRL
ncbi:quinone oxidoreductase family protein [Sphingobacterium lactis]|uniref:quinone oxidoreductase family protein n=1 Tax=Sphingobacterium lactis TaxID=797291 RepID=UPI003DA4024E